MTSPTPAPLSAKQAKFGSVAVSLVAILNATDVIAEYGPKNGRAITSHAMLCLYAYECPKFSKWVYGNSLHTFQMYSVLPGNRDALTE
jgi:hypothetical protein